MQLSLRSDLEQRVSQKLAAGVDANHLMEAALEAIAENEALEAAVEIGWQQAEAGDFVESSPQSVIRRADQ